MANRIMVSKETFTANVDGVPVTVRRNQTRIREGHPIMEGREHLFKEIDAHYDIERATKAPGEKRSRKKAS